MSERRSLLSYWPLLYAYEADGRDGRGVYGITDEFPVAQQRLRAALPMMPEGTVGTIRLAILDNRLPRPEYRYGPVIARLRRAKEGGGQVVDDDRTGAASREIPRHH